MKIKQLITVTGLLLAITCNVSGQFQATMHFIMSGDEKEFKVFSDENRYRYEFNEDGQEGIIIVLNDSEEVIILMPQQKMAIKTKASSQMSMASDPLKLYEYQVKEGGKEKAIGTETVNGCKCTKNELYGANGQLLYTMWYSIDYQFPIKIVSHIDVSGTTSMEMKDIKDWTPDDAMFIIPEGYRIMDQESMMPEH